MGGWAKPGVRIATNCFSLEEVKLLVKILKNKFDLVCTIQTLKASGNSSIYIKSSSVPILRKILLAVLKKNPLQSKVVKYLVNCNFKVLWLEKLY